MRTEGIVKSLDGIRCSVAVERKSACGENCAHCGGCSGGGVQICIAENSAGAGVGDRVVIEIDSGNVLKSAFLVYILPLLAFFAVYAAADGFFGQAAAGIVGAAAMLAVFAILRLFDKRLGGKCASRVVEVIQ